MQRGERSTQLGKAGKPSQRRKTEYCWDEYESEEWGKEEHMGRTFPRRFVKSTG